MSDYTGPGIYEILPQHAPSMSLNVWGGGTAAKTAVKLYDRSQNATNTHWEIVHAGGTQGKPEVGDREYHILSVSSGLYLAATAEGNGVVVDQKSPKDASVRWKISPAKNGAYYINSAAGGVQLNVAGAAKDSGSNVITYKIDSAANCQFILKVVG